MAVNIRNVVVSTKLSHRQSVNIIATFICLFTRFGLVSSTFTVNCIDVCQCNAIIVWNWTTKDLIRQLFNSTLVIQYDGIRRVMKSPSAMDESL